MPAVEQSHCRNRRERAERTEPNSQTGDPSAGITLKLNASKARVTETSRIVGMRQTKNRLAGIAGRIELIENTRCLTIPMRRLCAKTAD